MKEYRLTAWTDARAPFNSAAYRRILSDLSHRYLSVETIADNSGIRRQEISQFLATLERRGLLLERELFAPQHEDIPSNPLSALWRKIMR
jgi:predicted Rossmann fold nucleotide-binding protein DprA/Smf involved in DNA uptake